MKKNILISIASMFWICSFAQSYQSFFGNENTKWIITNRFVLLEESVWMDTISIFASENEYKVLEYQCKWSGHNKIIGKIRNNETNSKLFFIESNSTTELLIMDLDLEVGDAFSFSENGENRTIYVDDVYVFNGKKHIQFNDWIPLSTPPGGYKRVFIEGVGPNWGFESNDAYLIACKYDDFIKTYSFENEHIKDCHFKNVIIDNYVWKNSITIYPNPVFGQLVVNFPEMLNESIQLSVQNTLGVEVFNTVIFNSETILDLSHLPNSIYFFKFQTPETVISKKIIKF